MLRFAIRKSIGHATRGLSTLQRTAINKNRLLSAKSLETGRRFMGGHGPDISRLEAFLYIAIGGGGFAAFGMYQTKSMRDRIEAFETGKVLSFKSLTDDESVAFREKFSKLYGEEEEEEEEEQAEQEEEPQAPSLSDSAEPEPDVDAPVPEDEDLSLPRRIAKSEKDTVIFIEAPKE